MPRNASKRSLSESPLRSPSPPQRAIVAPSTPSRKRAKLEPSTPITSLDLPPTTTPLSASAKRKLRILGASLGTSPFPSHIRPTLREAQSVHELLSKAHGVPQRPPLRLVDSAGQATGGLPSILDLVVRSILSASTSSANATMAKEALDASYGEGDYRAVMEGGEEQLSNVIVKGGLGKKKAKAIMGLLKGIDARMGGTGRLSLNHLHDLDTRAAFGDLCTIDQIGIKSAACVLLFAMNREILPVDTHVHRIATKLGWLPSVCTADEAFFHLDTLLPPHLKHPLHSLLVSHGRGCSDCSSNGVTTMDRVAECPLVELLQAEGKGGGAKGRKMAGRERKGNID